jgi:hypothetical protein
MSGFGPEKQPETITMISSLASSSRVIAFDEEFVLGADFPASRYFERRITEALQRARAELPNGDKLPDVGEALFVDAVVKHAKQLVAGNPPRPTAR